MFRCLHLVVLFSWLGFSLNAAAEAPAVCFAPGTSPDYVEQMTRAAEAQGLSLGSNDTVSRFRLNSRWSSTATDGGGLVQGEPMTLTWSYIPDGLSIPGQIGEPTSNSNLFAWLNGIYGNFNTWHALFVQVFDRWSELTGINYVYQPSDDGAAMFNSAGALGVRGDVRVGAHLIDGNSNVLAYNFFPNTGDMVLDSADNFFNNTSNNSLGMRNVLAHEHGHGIGLNHVCPINQTKLMEPFVSSAFDGPQHDDILGSNRHYGDRLEENDASGAASVLGNIELAPANLSNLSIDDDGDFDFYSFTVGAGAAVDVSVTPLGLTYLEGQQNANGSCTAGTNFNSLSQNDLVLELRGTNGTSVLDTANASGAGGTESITGFTLPGAGTYFLRVSGPLANAQLYAIEASTNNLLFEDGFEAGNVALWDLCLGLGCPP